MQIFTISQIFFYFFSIGSFQNNFLSNQSAVKNLKNFDGLYIQSKLSLPLGEKNVIQLYFGLENTNYALSNIMDFEIDFLFSDVLISSEVECLSDHSCEYVSQEKFSMTYNGQTLSYNKIKIFLGLTKVKPNEVNHETIHAVSSLEAKLIINESFTKNVIGFGPKAIVFSYFVSIYNLRRNEFKMTIFNHDSYKFLVVTNLIQDLPTILEKEPGKSTSYSISSWFKIIDTLGRVTLWCGKACVTNKEPHISLLLQAEHYNALKMAICINEQKCNHLEDLDENFDKVEFVLSYGNQNDPDELQIVSIKGQELVEIDDSLRIRLLFEEHPDQDSNCSVNLEHLYFRNVFLMIKKDAKSGNAYVGVGQMKDKYIHQITNFSLSCHILVVFCYLVGMIYILYSKSKLKNEVNELSYRNLSFSETLFKKN